MVQTFTQTVATGLLGLMAVSLVILVGGIGACAIELAKMCNKEVATVE